MNFNDLGDIGKITNDLGDIGKITNGVADLAIGKQIYNAFTSNDPEVKALAKRKTSCELKFKKHQIKVKLALALALVLIICIILLLQNFKISIPPVLILGMFVGYVISFIRIWWLSTFTWPYMEYHISNANTQEELDKYKYCPSK